MTAPTTDVFLDYFRCPEHVSAFDTQGGLSADEGYFAFGGTTCHGRLAAGVPGPRPDDPALPHVVSRVDPVGTAVGLPFDLDEVVTNLREERYPLPEAPGLPRITASAAVRRLYDLLRPGLPVRLRKHLQRLHFRRWDRLAFPRWPVDVSVDSLMRTSMALAVKSRGGEPVPFIWFWPDGAPGAAMMTHDVEGPAGREFCPRLMEIDEAAGIASAFQVVPDASWEVSKAGTRAFIEYIRRRGSK